MTLIDLDDLMGIKELSDALKTYGYPWIERTNLTTWIARRDSYTSEHGETKVVPNGFPYPVKTFGMGGVYSYSAVLEWVVLHYGDVGDDGGQKSPARGFKPNDLQVALKRRIKS